LSGIHTRPQPLRIALVAPPYFAVPPSGYGGVEAVVASLAGALVARGHCVTVIGAGPRGTAAEYVPVWENPIPGRLGEAYPEVVHAAAVRVVIEDLATGPGLHLVHDHTQAGPLNAPAYARLGLPTVVTVHVPVNEEVHRVFLALRDVSLVAISGRQRELAPDLNWTATVHNAVDPGDWPYQPDKGHYALFLGRFHPDKGPHLALDAAHEAGLPLVLAGKCAARAEQEYFEQEIRPRLGFADRFVGSADATAKRGLLAGARCLLFPVQWEEPFGMVMIEAMACGTPVVALSCGSVPEVVDDGVTGIVCHDPAELAGALRRVGDIDPAACRKRVVEHFGTGTLAAGYERAYRTVLGCARS
jgi:glycosyltransferase involved in cell wall biosynthesis